jgi:hypothetical protein
MAASLAAKNLARVGHCEGCVAKFTKAVFDFSEQIKRDAHPYGVFTA